ncbi:HAUS augmin-like complex subunit 4 [Entomophthora muscae]|uniref:HAUS augmin-like complex subunit 4 n=1 Tax=Entomophthora muscae TaxID=34485 RepID=A0ACC2U6W2_9FUNG|nr:HAUS augmin-like complex subunit 4 [Entomophthora muscae]
MPGDQRTWKPIANIDTLPLPPPDKDLLKRTPHFANLLKQINSHQRVFIQNNLQPRCIAAKKKCDENRQVYLKYKTLKEEIDSVTLAEEIKSQKPFNSDFSKLNQLAPIAVSAVSLPDSANTIFGVEKEALLYTPDTGKEDILEQVEVSLKMRCSEINQFASHLQTMNGDSDFKLPGALQKESHATDCLAESQHLHDSLHSLQVEYFSRLSTLVEVTEQNISMALQVIQAQITLLGPHVVACTKYLTAIATSLRLKFQVVKYQLLDATYSSSRIPTLREARQQLEADAETASRGVEYARTQLSQYKAAGPEFMKLAQTYHDMLSKINTLKEDIERLKA